MSKYTDFVQDFPERCRELLDLLSPDAALVDRDVTLLLAIASAGFVTPFERLRPRNEDDPPHPTGDTQKYPKATQQLADLLNKPFLDSEIWGSFPGSWERSVRPLQIDGRVAPPMPGQYTRLSRDVQVSEVLAAVRNALAHGHVFTEGDPVQSIVFGTARHVRRELVGYRFLRATVHDVRHLLTTWFDFLARHHVPYREAAEAVADAA